MNASRIVKPERPPEGEKGARIMDGFFFGLVFLGVLIALLVCLRFLDEFGQIFGGVALFSLLVSAWILSTFEAHSNPETGVHIIYGMFAAYAGAWTFGRARGAPAPLESFAWRPAKTNEQYRVDIEAVKQEIAELERELAPHPAA